MGADPFIISAAGDTARTAFDEAVEEAQHEYGHGGYTGSIAEKDSFLEIELTEGMDPVAEANRMIDEDDHRISDKWGPAGAFSLGNGRYLFFGLAPS
jgi:hypothetical protein